MCHDEAVTVSVDTLMDIGRRAGLIVGALDFWRGDPARVVLGAVVTDAPLSAADPEPMADGCGSCRQCLDGCPTGAIVAPGTVDARRCLAWLVQDAGVFDPEYRVALGDRIYGCDDCAEVCPPNRVRVRLETRNPARCQRNTGVRSSAGPGSKAGEQDAAWGSAARHARRLRRRSGGPIRSLVYPVAGPAT